MNPKTFLQSLQGYTNQIKKPIQATAEIGAQFGNVSAKSLSSALQQAIEAFQRMRGAGGVVGQRAKKGATPVANLDTGDILMSDGTVQLSPENKARKTNYTPTPMDQARLNALKANLISQTAYTPDVQAQIENVQFIPYGGGRVSSQDNLSAGLADGSGNIYINRNTLDNPYYAITTARHELLHNFDDNLYRSTDKGGSFGNSDGFSDELKNRVQGWYDQIVKGTLRSNPGLYQPNKRTDDIESYAYYGQEGPKVLNQDPEIAKRYTGMYAPYEKNINASPLYPSDEYMRYFSNWKKSSKKK